MAAAHVTVRPSVLVTIAIVMKFAFNSRVKNKQLKQFVISAQS